MSAANNGRSAGAASRNNRTRRNKMLHVVENNVNSRLIHRNVSGREVSIAGPQFHLPRAVIVPEFSLPRAVEVPEFSLPRAVTPAVIENAAPFTIHQLMSVIESSSDKEVNDLYRLIMSKYSKHNTDTIVSVQKAREKELKELKELLKPRIQTLLAEFNIEEYIRENVLSKKLRTLSGKQLSTILLGAYSYSLIPRNGGGHNPDYIDRPFKALDTLFRLIYRSMMVITGQDLLLTFYGTSYNRVKQMKFEQEMDNQYDAFFKAEQEKLLKSRIFDSILKYRKSRNYSLFDLDLIGSYPKEKADIISGFNSLIDQNAIRVREYYSAFKDSINEWLVS